MQPIATVLPSKPVRLLGPGPCNPHPEVLAAQSQPLLGHLDPRFTTEIMAPANAGLLRLFNGGSSVASEGEGTAFAASGTGSAGMELLAANLLERGERVVVGVNGVFGGRIAECCGKLGAVPVKLEKDFGDGFSPEEVTQAIDAQFADGGKKVAAVWLVLAETSTAYLQGQVAEIARAVRASKSPDALFLLDCVTAIGGSEVRCAEWGVDAAFAGTQKCLGIPPALAPVFVGPRALAKFRARESPVPSWYLDLKKLLAYYEGTTDDGGATKRVYHHTAPISSCYALYEGVRVALTPRTGQDAPVEGDKGRDAVVDALVRRYQRVGARMSAGLLARNFSYAVEDPARRLPQLHCVFPPPGVSEAKLRELLMSEEGIEVGGGLGGLAGKVVRIGVMGANAEESVVDGFLAALDRLLPSCKL
jgi:alanine-glyoxylate transaminase / serine-glyoxylate transaminase / serine-pyruvate transaminase